MIAKLSLRDCFIVVLLLIRVFFPGMILCQDKKLLDYPKQMPGLSDKVAQSEIQIEESNKYLKLPNAIPSLSGLSGINNLYSIKYHTDLYDVLDFDSSYYIIGNVYDITHATYEPDNPALLLRLKLDYYGNIQWYRIDSVMWGDHFPLSKRSIIQASDGNIISVGVVDKDFKYPKNWDIRIPVYTKFNRYGDTIWQKVIIDTNNRHTGDLPQSIIAENDGGFSVAALILSDSKTYSLDTNINWWYSDSTYIGLIRYDSNGQETLRKRICVGGDPFPRNLGEFIKIKDGGYIVGGENRFNGANNLANYYLLKVDSAFNFQWIKQFSQSALLQSFMSLRAYSDSTWVISTFRSDAPVYVDPYGFIDYTGYHYVGILNSTFDVVKDSMFGMYLTNPPSEWYYDNGFNVKLEVSKGNNRGFVLASKVGQGANLIKLNGNLSYSWNRWLAYYPYWYERPYNLRLANDGGYLIVGITAYPGGGGWFVKTDSNGFSLPNGGDTLFHIGINEMSNSSECRFSIYPNPSNDISWIDLSDNPASQSKGYMHIFNTCGILVFEKSIPAASRIEEIPTSNFGPGLYFVSVTYERKRVYIGKLLVK